MYVNQVRNTMDISQLRERKADDIQLRQRCRQEWQSATQNTVEELDKKCREPQCILFFIGAVYEITYNDPTKQGKFAHSQLALLLDLPSQDHLDNFRRIPVYIPPPGIKSAVYDPNKTQVDYINEGYVKTMIGTPREITHNISGHNQARRKQYGLKHHFTSTIHAGMGETLNSVAVEISKDGLWEKAQVVVAISRTRVGKNTIFVGNNKVRCVIIHLCIIIVYNICNEIETNMFFFYKKETMIETLKKLIQQSSQWSDYMEHILDMATVNSNMPFRQQRYFPFRICDMEIPQCNTGFVYMLISLRNKKAVYIGETKCLRTRLQQHNSGNGSQSTAVESLRPYGVFAYVCGFNGSRDLRLQVEELWKRNRDRKMRQGVNNPKELAYCVQNVIEDINDKDETSLRLVLLFHDN